jgi:hypothetical protein
MKNLMFLTKNVKFPLTCQTCKSQRKLEIEDPK